MTVFLNDSDTPHPTCARLYAEQLPPPLDQGVALFDNQKHFFGTINIDVFWTLAGNPVYEALDAGGPVALDVHIAEDTDA